MSAPNRGRTMIKFELGGLLIDWTLIGFQISIFSITYPFGDVFRTDSLFCLALYQGEWYLELCGIVLIGQKGPGE